jgi:hypothetical protein
MSNIKQSAGSSSNGSNLTPVAEVARLYENKFRNRGTEKLFNMGDNYQAIISAWKNGILDIEVILGDGRTSLYVDPTEAAKFLKGYATPAENILRPIPGDTWANPTTVAKKFFLSKPTDPSSGRPATYLQVYNRLIVGAERGYYLRKKVSPNTVMMGLEGMTRHLDRCFPEHAMTVKGLVFEAEETNSEEFPVEKTEVPVLDIEDIYELNDSKVIIGDLLESIAQFANCSMAAAEEVNLTHKFKLLDEAQEWALIAMDVVSGTQYEAVLKSHLISQISLMPKAA